MQGVTSICAGAAMQMGVVKQTPNKKEEERDYDNRKTDTVI
jgi:hypothetical protein